MPINHIKELLVCWSQLKQLTLGHFQLPGNDRGDPNAEVTSNVLDDLFMHSLVENCRKLESLRVFPLHYGRCLLTNDGMSRLSHAKQLKELYFHPRTPMIHIT